MGEFQVELYWKHAPMTCRNFAELAKRGKLSYFFSFQAVIHSNRPSFFYLQAITATPSFIELSQTL